MRNLGARLTQANAQRSPRPFWDVLAAVMAAVDALPQAVRIGRSKPLGAATPKQVREIGRLLERTHIFAGTTVELPPQIAPWARTSTKQERAGIKVQLRLRAGYGGLDRVRVTGGKGNDNPYDPATGKILWQTGDPQNAAAYAAPVVANGVVYVGSMAPSGDQMYALDAATGEILWRFAAGGSVGAHPAVADGRVYWGSGFGLFGGASNNRLYVFGLDGK